MSEMKFEQALEFALFDDLEKDYISFLESGFELPPHTKKYLRFERKILSDPVGYLHQRGRSVWKTVLRKAALIIIAITVFFGLMMTIPPVRAFVFSVIEEFTDHNEHTTNIVRPEGTVNEYDISYLPNGFVEHYDNHNGMKIYSNGEFIISFLYDYVNESAGVALDTEYTYVGPIAIGDNTGSLYESTVDNRNSVILWYDTIKSVYFILSANIDVDELIQVAESVKPAE